MDIKFKGDGFSSLMKICSIVHTDSEDLTIKDSKIRQPNKSGRCVYEIDICDIVGPGVDLEISNLKQKTDLLEIFQKQKSTMGLKISKNTFQFYDSYSMTNMTRVKSIQSKFLDDAMYDKITGAISQDGDVIFETEVSRLILDRFGACAKAMDADSFTVEFGGDSAKFKVSISSNNSPTTMNILNVPDMEFTLNGKAVYPIYSLLKCTPPLEIQAFRKPSNKFIVLKVNSIVGEDPEIPMTMWYISNFVNGG